jgi:uncharacterized protein YfaS (alpha-2-macroglobulin family)
MACPAALAQDATALHVVKSTVNAESENAEFCLEFNRPLATTSPSHLASNLKLEADDKIVTPPNIAATDSSLCLFPLERGQSYRLAVQGLRGADDEIMGTAYKTSFTIPDRTPALVFTGKNGGVNEFGSYDNPLTLRSVNVARATLDVYRITDPALMAHVWQDRTQTTLAPSESAYLARSKGQQVLREEDALDASPNATAEQQISLHDKLPNLAPGLYLIVADAGNDDDKPANKGLAPLAATWFTKSNFSVRAVRDDAGIHVFAAPINTAETTPTLHLTAFSKKPEQLAEAQSGDGSIGLIPYPPKLADTKDLASVVASYPDGNIAFADIEDLPVLSGRPVLGAIHTEGLFAAPFDPVDVSLALAPSGNAVAPTGSSVLRLSQGDFVYTYFPVPALTAKTVALSFPAPAAQGMWTLRWQKADGTILADAPLRITENADAPHLEVTTDHDTVTGDGWWPITVHSQASSGSPVPLVGGHVSISWQKLDPAVFGWKDYRFGNPVAILDAPAPTADFLTDLQGAASLHVTLPARPPERGLYQAVLKVTAEADAGIADAAPLVLPLRPEGTVIGLKPLAKDARFAQNSLARFAAIGLSSDGKPRDVSGLSYQVYEEGRSFAWYQNEGRWKYKPEAQLRPIGGGALTIKADASSVLEWPVTAGNYRLEILDSNGKLLAQTGFSAGWDSSGAEAALRMPLNVQMPKTLQPGHEVLAHVTLPEAAMLTVIVADTRIRKIVHEFRPKGDNVIAFTPTEDWLKTISLSVEATPQNAGGASLRALIEAPIEPNKTDSAEPAAESVAVVATDNPSALVLRKGGAVVLTFGVENNGAIRETYHYAFTASPGLKIESGDKGEGTLNGGQSRSLSLAISGDAPGTKELRLEVAEAHTPRLVRVWNMAVLPQADSLRSAESVSIAPRQSLLPVPAKPREGNIALISRLPMNGLAEILSYVFNARPFTTEELALSADALRLWKDTLSQMGLAPDFTIVARRQEQLEQLLRHQNTDGGFASQRGGDSTMDDTAAALTALGPEVSESIKPAKNLAIAWLKQRLANTWLDDKERGSRAAAYAALAAADAVDPASLHYFSDTSATGSLPPLAEADIAASFKHIKDPDAAAFWIKKMLDENSAPKNISLLNALAATDALSSDDVTSALTEMADALHHDKAPALLDAAALLRAIAASNANVGQGTLAVGKETRAVSGVLVARTSDPAMTSYSNGGAQSLYVTFVTESNSSLSQLPHGVTLARHIYRLNGVELSPNAPTAHGEIYMVELKGAAPDLAADESILVQDGGSGLRPLGCPLSAKLDTLSFIPWFTTHGLTPVSACEFSPHGINVVALIPPESDSASFSIVYFAHIDAHAANDIPQPQLRLLK